MPRANDAEIRRPVTPGMSSTKGNAEYELVPGRTARPSGPERLQALRRLSDGGFEEGELSGFQPFDPSIEQAALDQIGGETGMATPESRGDGFFPACHEVDERALLLVQDLHRTGECASERFL